MTTKSSFERSLQPIILTASGVLIGLVLGVVVNLTAAILYFVMLALPLFMLWLSRDVPTHEERLAASEGTRAKRPAPAPAPAEASREPAASHA